MRRIQLSIEQELKQQKMQLIYQIIKDPKFLKLMTTAPKLTSNHNNCKLELSNKCNRLRISTLLANKGFLFLNHIYLTLYNTILKQYLISFAIMQDFFYSFFGTIKDNLDQLMISFYLPLNNYGGSQKDKGRINNINDAKKSRQEDKGGMQDVNGKGLSPN